MAFNSSLPYNRIFWPIFASVVFNLHSLFSFQGFEVGLELVKCYYCIFVFSIFVCWTESGQLLHRRPNRFMLLLHYLLLPNGKAFEVAELVS